MEQSGLNTADLVRALQRAVRSRRLLLPGSVASGEQTKQQLSQTLAVGKAKSPRPETGSIMAGERTVSSSSVVPEHP